jgi:hypothetical protein
MKNSNEKMFSTKRRQESFYSRVSRLISFDLATGWAVKCDFLQYSKTE